MKCTPSMAPCLMGKGQGPPGSDSDDPAAALGSETPICNVLIIYSDDTVTSQVIEAYSRIEKALEPAQRVEICFWLVDLLREPRLLPLANQNLAAAQMIVVNAADARVT